MKKKKIILGFITIAGAGLCALGKTKTQKSLGAVASILAGGALLYDSFEEEREKVEKDCHSVRGRDGFSVSFKDFIFGSTES